MDDEGGGGNVKRRRIRDRALFDLAIDSKLRGCDLVEIKIGTLVAGPTIRTRSMVQQTTGRPVQFEITPDAEVVASKTSRFRAGLIRQGISVHASMRGWL